MTSASQVGPLVPPLVPVITRYDRTIEEVARAEARHVDQALDPVRSVGRSVFVDPKPFVALVAKVITEGNGDVSTLAEAVAERPEVLVSFAGRLACWVRTGSARKPGVWQARSVLTLDMRANTGQGGMSRRQVQNSGSGRSRM